jgi:phospholipid/cholesterol/gamma-HCH transport system permease protein
VIAEERVSVTLRIDRDGDRARLVATGPFDLAHAGAVAQAVSASERDLAGCRSIDVDLAGLDHLDGSGALQLAQLIDRLEAGGRPATIIAGVNVQAARQVALYRRQRADPLLALTRARGRLARLGATAAALPGTAISAFDFLGHASSGRW